MSQNTVQQIHASPCFMEQHASPCIMEQRINYLDEASYLLVVTKRGVGEILHIDSKGLFFGCLYPHHFPDELHLDIIDGNNIFIKEIKAEKLRECFNDSPCLLTKFELVIGVEFVDPAPCQSDDLDHLLRTLGQSEAVLYDNFCPA